MSSYLRTLSLICLFLLSACGRISGITPETAVIRELVSGRDKADPASIQILQKQPLQEHLFHLVKYQAKDPGELWQVCWSVYDVIQDENHT